MANQSSRADERYAAPGDDRRMDDEPVRGGGGEDIRGIGDADAEDEDFEDEDEEMEGEEEEDEGAF